MRENVDTVTTGPYGGLKINIMQEAGELTGFEEIAIERAFGRPFEKLPGMQGLRCLLFIHLKRDGMSDRDAYQSAQSATVSTLNQIIDKGDDAGNGGSPTQPTDWAGLTPTS